MKNHTLQLTYILRTAIVAGLEVVADMDSDTWNDGLWFTEEERTYTKPEMKTLINEMNIKMDSITRASNLIFIINHSKHEQIEFTHTDIKLILRACQTNYDFTRDTLFEEFLDNKAMVRWKHDEVVDNVQILSDQTESLNHLKRFMNDIKQYID